jgi:hypothetical protein
LKEDFAIDNDRRTDSLTWEWDLPELAVFWWKVVIGSAGSIETSPLRPIRRRSMERVERQQQHDSRDTESDHRRHLDENENCAE